ncbi:hypothetical protein D3C86_1466750 [compost metagenome]
MHRIGPGVDHLATLVVIQVEYVGQARSFGRRATRHIVQATGEALTVGDELRQPFRPPGGAIEGVVAEAAVLVEATIQVVHVLVAQVPHLEGGALPLSLIGEEAGLVAGTGRIPLDIDAAVVGGDTTKQGAAVALPVGGGVEDHQLQRLVVVITHRLPACFHLLMELLLLGAQLAADAVGLILA